MSHTARSPGLLRLLVVVVTVALTAFIVASGCGRSSLEDSLILDGGSLGDAGACGPTTCPTGCCDAAGICRSGTDVQACGTLGGKCASCPSLGFDVCDGSRRTCGKRVTTCDSTTCSTGCCLKTDTGENVCLAGTSATACGVEGGACQDCARDGRSCDVVRRTCGESACNATNCKGCCVGSQCVGGTDNKACGSGGAACKNCDTTGQTCDAKSDAGAVCVGTPSCSPANCGGCCLGTQCLIGADNTACGKGGAACQNCTGAGQICGPLGTPNERTCQAQPACGPANCAGCCAGNTCVNPPTAAACGQAGAACKACAANETCQAGACRPTTTCADTCAGCCQGNTCFGGFLDNRCGSGGAACQNCTGGGNTCNTAAVPRTCQAQPTCPANYPSCPAGVTTNVLPRHTNVCDPAVDLADAAAACVGGLETVACQAWLAFLKGKPACAACVAPFAVPVTDLTGLYNCVAPFVSGACNRSTGCEVDCETKSCAACPPAGLAACQQQVQAGQCLTFVQQSGCIVGALVAGQGAFCNPANPAYGGNYGAWLQAVATQYCGP